MRNKWSGRDVLKIAITLIGGIVFSATPIFAVPAYADPPCPEGQYPGTQSVRGYILCYSNPDDIGKAGKQVGRIAENGRCGANNAGRMYEAFNSTNGTYGPSRQCLDENANPVEQKPPSEISCSSITGYFKNPFVCIGRTIGVVIGWALISVSAWLLAAAGYLFNALIFYTVTNFGVLFTPGVKEALGVAWSAMRDIANIIIICMFVFIAINMILGVKEFGEKKLVARVLIIAVLLNFSLLFSKGIIDAGNFIATQFYQAANLDGGGTTLQGTLEKKFAEKGIAGQFIQMMRLPTSGATWDALSAGAFGDPNKKYENASGWLALLHGLVTAAIFFFAAAVLLYGAYLLLARAVLLIFLMLTSALAFASWLVPHHRLQTAWTTWWESLLKAAFFAPILLIFLWASIYIGSALGKATKGGLGDLVTNPGAELSLGALVNYFMILGLLFVSIYIASSLSQSIAGFAAAGKFVGAPTFSALALGSRSVGLASRGLIGAPAGYIATKMKEKGWADNAWGRFAMRPFSAIAKRPFDVMTTKAAQQVVKGVGGLTFGTEFGKGGHFGAVDRAAAKLEKYAREVAPSSEARKTLSEEAGDKAGLAAVVTKKKQVDDSRDGLAGQKTAAEGAAEAAKAIAATVKREHETAHGGEIQSAEKGKRDAEREKTGSEAVLKELSQELARSTDAGRRADIQREMTRHDSNIDAQDARIRDASRISERLDAQLNRTLAERGGNVQEKEREVTRLTAALDELNRSEEGTLNAAYDAAKAIAKHDRDVELQAASIAKSMAQSVYYLGRQTSLQKSLGGKIKQSKVRDFMAATGEKIDTDEAAAPTPGPTPPAPSSPSTPST